MNNLVRGTVYVVDDDDAFRDSLEWLLSGHKFDVTAFTSGEAFVSFAKTLPKSIAKQTDARVSTRRCVILDVRMPTLSGLQVQEQLQALALDLPIIFVTAHGDVPMAVEAIKRGAYDFIEKPFDDVALVARVETALAHSETSSAKSNEIDATRALIDSLTSRERQIMDLVIEGKLNKTIAYDLDISIKTVEAHRARVMEKLEAKSLAQLVMRVHAARTTT
jgi:two-component system, LuxR family, response regulator TtrR